MLVSVEAALKDTALSPGLHPSAHSFQNSGPWIPHLLMLDSPLPMESLILLAVLRA